MGAAAWAASTRTYIDRPVGVAAFAPTDPEAPRSLRFVLHPAHEGPPPNDHFVGFCKVGDDKEVAVRRGEAVTITLKDSPELGVTFAPWCNTRQSEMIPRVVELGPSSSHSRRTAVISQPGVVPHQREFPLMLVGNPAQLAEPLPKRQRFAPTPGCDLLIFVCSPSIYPLPQALKEAEEIKATCTAWICHVTSNKATAQELRGQLSEHRPRRFLFSGHGNAPYMGGYTLGFARPDGGALEVVGPKLLSTLLGSQGEDSEGTLDLCFLNGCNTEALGRAAREAGVPTAVCWRTEAHDGAAKLFSTVFFKTVSVLGRTYRQAFDEAVRAVRLETAVSASGTHMPKFVLRGPTPAELKELGAQASYPRAAGVPVLIDAAGTRYSGDVSGD